ncbi:MAG: pyridoxal phosphate enzyme (YggS family) [Acidimicrobiales bacterium]|jgi:pyridoxal phosphate enzyme (YggS family)
MSDLTVAQFAERLAVVHQRIEAAGGSLQTTSVLAVSKTFPAAAANVALAAGAVDLGENYGQELEAKAPEVPGARWHFIGGLQRNKVKRIAGVVAVWHTVDRSELANEIAKRAPGTSVFVQVNTTGEAQKSGCEPAGTAAMVEHCRHLGLDVRGLMTIGPTDGSHPGASFAQLRALGEASETLELSMGMSADLEAAVAEGSTMVRVGSALFGARLRF